jgi:hypothetical protein
LQKCDVLRRHDRGDRTRHPGVRSVCQPGYHGQAARKIAEAVYGRYGMNANTSYAERFMLARSTTYTALPLAEPVALRTPLSNQFASNDLPGDLLLAAAVASATPQRRSHPAVGGRTAIGSGHPHDPAMGS